MRSGLVGLDGTSAIPEGIVDSSAGADSVQLNEELDKRLDKMLSEELEHKARYKLEIAFTEDRSSHRPFGGFVSAWTNGGYANGGGDEVVYFCPSIVEIDGRKRTCSGPLDLKWVNKNAAVCPRCRTAVNPKELAGQIYAKLHTAQWAELITRMWANLGGDADIRLGTLRGDLHRATENEMNRDLGGEQLRKVRQSREWLIYPLRNIIKDTSTGSSIGSRILAFLNA